MSWNVDVIINKTRNYKPEIRTKGQRPERVKQLNIMETKKKYIAPHIESIQLDNEISLVLESTPPEGPGENVVMLQHYKSNDVFKV